MSWALEFNVALLESAIRDLRPEFDIIHAHDWIVGYASRALKHAWRVPLVCTVHATECGRQNGLHTPMQRHISETEWWMCFESWRIITCSHCMRREVMGTFGVPGDKIRVIPNGISNDWFEIPRKPSQDPTILYVGRLVPEKGPQVAVEAMPDILRQFPKAKLLIAGTGPMEDHLRKQLADLRLGASVELLGMQRDRALRELYGKAHVAVFPSSYEPFGIVALEAMASGVPCIVGDAGGLSEIIRHSVTGLKVRPKDPMSLASAVKQVLSDKHLSQSLQKNARKVAYEEYSWDDIAERTRETYSEVIHESLVTSFSRRKGDRLIPFMLEYPEKAVSASRGDDDSDN
jgi:glycogen(starch) synthase